MAVVLRRLDYSETSQILAVFTRLHGQQRLIAKGVKRSTKSRVAVGIDLLELGRVVFSSRGGKEGQLATLTEWQQVDNFPHLRRDLVRSYAAQYAAEITSHLTEVQDPHADLFDGLHRFILSLDRGDALRELVAYLWLVLTEVGLRPELSCCVSCRRDIADGDPLYFSSRQGGALCRDCEPAAIEKRRISYAVARSLVTPDDNRTATTLPTFDLLDYHMTEILTRPPKLSPMLRSVLAPSAPRTDHRPDTPA
jgi:DNA repair protein RecO (recombination protein O)